MRAAISLNELRNFGTKYTSIIPSMFAAVSDLYAKYWHDFFHFAIFEEGEVNWDLAFEKTHRSYMNAIKVSEAQDVLDLSCGRGKFTDLLSQNTKGRVIGVDISPGQLRHTRRFKRENLHFKQHDVMKIDELPGCFDAITYIDAACYLPDKFDALKRIHKKMRPGARLLLIDWCKSENINSVQEEIVLDPFTQTWAIPNLWTPTDYENSFRRIGLKIIKSENLNSRVKPNWDFAYDSAIRAVQDATSKNILEILWNGPALGKTGIQMVKDQFASALYIKAAFDASFLKYAYFLVERPAD
jgi:cyclopropane fatty-acyl-phospholipid synthase-like methyltransferase